MGADYTEVLYEVDDPVAIITLNRPAALNAMTGTMQAEIHGALREAQDDPAVVGIIITGAGRGFSAGADMNMLAGLGPSSSSSDAGPPLVHAGDRSWGDDFDGLFTSILSVPKPVIAAINGAVAGMSVALALACDLRFMAPDAKFTTAFAERGLIAEWGTSWLLPRLVGPSVALDLLFSSRVLKGQECLDLGLVNRVADDSVAEARDYIGHLAARCSPTSLGLMKRQIYQQLHRDGLGAADTEANRMMVESFSRPDFPEGVQAFLQKRPPAFGRVAGYPVETPAGAAAPTSS